MDDGDTARPFGGPLRWILLLGAANLVLATIGYARYLPEGRFSDAAFYALNLMFLNYHAVEGQPIPLTLDIARFAAHVLFGAAVVAALVALLRDRVDRWYAGRARDQVVVIGGGELARDLAVAYRTAPRPTRGRRPVALVGAPDGVRARLRAHGIRLVPDADEQQLSRIVGRARRTIVAGGDDDATLRWATQLPPTTGAVHLVVDDRDLARELRGSGFLLDPASVDVCCAPERIASHVLASQPPRRDGHVAPPPVVIGTGTMAAEMVRRMAFGWHRPADPLPIVCAGPDVTWSEELVEVCRGRAVLDIRADATTTRRAHQLVAEIATTHRPAAAARDRRVEDGILVVITGLTNAATLTLATKIAATVARARVVAIVTDDTNLQDTLAHRRWADDATLQVVNARRVLATPAVIEADTARRLAEELHRDAVQWPDDEPPPVGPVDRVAFDDLPAEQRTRLVGIADASLAAMTDSDLPLDEEGEPVVFGPATLAALARRLAPALSRDAGGDDAATVTHHRGVRLAAALPAILARVGLVIQPGSDHDGLSADDIDVMAAEAHRQYVRTQARHGNLTDSRLAEQGWDDLDDFARESNRDQVRDIPAKLASVHLTLARGDEPDRSWLDATVVEDLARWEHARWVHLHRLAGYRAGSPTDHAHRVHEYLVGWDELPAGTDDDPGPRELDRSAVAAIPDILAAVSSRAVPATGAREHPA